MKRFPTLLASLGLLWLRVLVGAGIAYHGYGKVFGGNIVQLTQGVANMGFPMPEFFAWLSALTEFGGGILIALGLATRLMALLLFINMSVAAFIAHAGDPLERRELALAYFSIAGALVMLGAGEYSIDALFLRRRNRKKR